MYDFSVIHPASITPEPKKVKTCSNRRKHALFALLLIALLIYSLTRFRQAL